MLKFLCLFRKDHEVRPSRTRKCWKATAMGEMRVARKEVDGVKMKEAEHGTLRATVGSPDSSSKTSNSCESLARSCQSANRN